MKILLIKDHTSSSINGFHERIRAITNCRPIELKKEDDDEQFYNFPKNTVPVYFESIIVYRSTRRACCLSEKAYNICVWEF